MRSQNDPRPKITCIQWFLNAHFPRPNTVYCITSTGLRKPATVNYTYQAAKVCFLCRSLCRLSDLGFRAAKNSCLILEIELYHVTVRGRQ